MIFLTSDLHFSHHRIMKYTERPYKTVEEMNQDLIQRFNSRVTNEDHTFIIGDFALATKAKARLLLSKLRGEKTLLEGNHDPDGWTKIQGVIISYGGYTIGLVHDPEFAIQGNIDFSLTGHVHTLWKHRRIDGKLCINVGVDVWNYAPASLPEIIKYREHIQENINVNNTARDGDNQAQ